MSDIELIIKIPENTYRRIQALSMDNYFEHDICGDSMQRIANGTPLPKGHGRLIDETEANGLIAEGKDGNKAYFGTTSKDWEVIDFLKTVPTVIESESEIKDEFHKNKE